MTSIAVASCRQLARLIPAQLRRLSPAPACKHSLQENEQLEELFLTGNPCCGWHGYRPFVLGTLPHLRTLDDAPVRPSERIAAAQQLPELGALLRAELLAEGIDPDEAAQVCTSAQSGLLPPRVVHGILEAAPHKHAALPPSGGG